MRIDATFIGIEVSDAVVDDAELAKRLQEACPVDIFAADGGKVAIVEENVDECVLCGLCLDAAGGRGPESPVKVLKLYDDDAVLA